MTGEQTVLLHEPVNPLAVDGLQAAGPPLAIEMRGDPAVAVGGPRVDEAPDVGGKFSVTVAALGPRLVGSAFIRAATLERATPSVSVTGFIGNRPEVKSSTARSVFLSVPDRALPSGSRPPWSCDREAVPALEPFLQVGGLRKPALSRRRRELPHGHPRSLDSSNGKLASATNHVAGRPGDNLNLRKRLGHRPMHHPVRAGLCLGLSLGPPAKAGARSKRGAVHLAEVTKRIKVTKWTKIAKLAHLERFPRDVNQFERRGIPQLLQIRFSSRYH